MLSLLFFTFSGSRGGRGEVECWFLGGLALDRPVALALRPRAAIPFFESITTVSTMH